MSGGHFEYHQYYIDEIADSIDKYINGEDIDDDEIENIKLDYERGYSSLDENEYDYVLENHHTIPNRYNFSEETIDEMKKGLDYLRKASIYAQRIDWLISDDDGEEEFHERLIEDLNNLKFKD